LAKGRKTNSAAAVICVWVRIQTNFDMLIMLNLKEICH
jgi:hypothetical protein